MGLTVIADVVAPPGCQSYKVAVEEVAVSVVLCPSQIVLLPPTETVGVGFTVTLYVTAEAFVQPIASVTDTVYSVPVLGLTVIADVVAPPGCQSYKVAVEEVAVSVVLCPSQIVLLPPTETVGVGFTVTL